MGRTLETPRVTRRVKALVIGASGFIGGYLLQTLGRKGVPALGTYFPDAVKGLAYLDYCDTDALKRLLDEAAPEVVFCPAAQPNVDWCESHPGESYRTNVVGAQNVAAACAERSAAMVFFSSEYVFDGEAGPYSEQDTPHPISVYGWHKLAAEEAVRSLLQQEHIIARTTVVYGWERQPKNYVVNLIRSLREGRTCRAPEDQNGSPTYAPNLAEAVVELAERRLLGTWHIVGPERMNRYEFACLAARTFDLDASLIEPVSTAALQQKAARPLKAGLLVEKAMGALRTRLLCPSEGLRSMRDEETSNRRGMSA